MPTFSLISQPQTLAPVNAPLWFVGSSTNNKFPFFKYNFQLYKYNRYNLSDRTFLGQFKIPPRPTTNLGVFDAHKVLQSQVGSYIFSYTQSGIVPVVDNNSVVLYKGLFGYEYNPNYKFENTFSYTYPNGGYLQYAARTTQLYNAVGLGVLYPNYDDLLFDYFTYKPLNSSLVYFKFNDGLNTSYYQITSVVYRNSYFFEVSFTPDITSAIYTGVDYNLTFFYIDNTTYLGLSFSTPDLLKQNDIITIQMTDPNFNSSYNGQALVLTELTTTPTYKYIVNVVYGNVHTGAETGSINLLQRNSGYTNYAYAFPGTRQYIENNVDFGITKEISNNNWAINYTKDKQIFSNQYETLSLMSLAQGNFNNCYYEVKTYGVNKNLLSTYTSVDPIGPLPNNQNFSIKYELSTGTKNLQGWTMSGTPIDLGTVSYYSVSLINSNNNPRFNAVFTYSIVPNCSVFPNIRIQFMNRNGGYDYWNFNYDNKWVMEINKTLFTKQLDYNYNIGDRGRTILNMDASMMYSANTDWINEYDYNYLQELFTSPDVYVIDEVNGYKLPINIEDKTYEQKTANREKIFNLTITYRYAFDVNLQGG